MVVAWLGLADWRVCVPWGAPQSHELASPIESQSSPSRPTNITSPSRTARPTKKADNGPREPAQTEMSSPTAAVPPGEAQSLERPTSPIDIALSAAKPFRFAAKPDTLVNRGLKMTVYFQVEGARPGAGLDVEVASLYSDQGGGCAKFSGQGCSLISEGFDEADGSGNAVVKVQIYPCAMIDYTTYDPASVTGTYRAWVKDRKSGTVESTTFSVRNAGDLPPVDSWQGGQCIT